MKNIPLETVKAIRIKEPFQGEYFSDYQLVIDFMDGTSIATDPTEMLEMLVKKTVEGRTVIGTQRGEVFEEHVYSARREKYPDDWKALLDQFLP